MLLPFISSSLERHKAEHAQLDIGGEGTSNLLILRYNLLGSVTVAAGNTFYEFEASYEIVKAYCFLGASGEGDTIVVLKKGVTSIVSTTIPSAGTRSNTAVLEPAFSVIAGDRISVDVTAAGAGAQHLQVVVFYRSL